MRNRLSDTDTRVIPSAVIASTKVYWNPSGIIARVNVRIPQLDRSISAGSAVNIRTNTRGASWETANTPPVKTRHSSRIQRIPCRIRAVCRAP